MHQLQWSLISVFAELELFASGLGVFGLAAIGIAFEALGGGHLLAMRGMRF
jgi:hypothetical protein